jgi:hypothetical protein
LLVVLPLAALALAILTLGSKVGNGRLGVLAGAVIWGVALTAITEVLSLFGQLTVANVGGAWALICVGLLAIGLRSRELPVHVHVSMPRSTRTYPWLALAAGVGLLWLALLAVALVAAPNTFDSMTYHLPRVMHWIENASVWPYPTNILRQLYMSPWAEFAALHVQLLVGSDRLANTPQAMALLGVMLGASLVVQQLGGGGAAQVTGAAIAGTLPIGVLQATSTQTDEVVAFWLVCFVVFARRLAFGHRPLTFALLAGASLGLAILTKPTAYLFALPFAMWLSFALVRRSGALAWKPIVVVAGVALLLNAGQYARNLLVFDSPLGRGDEGGPTFRYANDTLSPSLIASNVVRNLALHLVATPKLEVNQVVANAVTQAHERLGLDVDDPRSTFGDTPFGPQPAYGEDTAGNPLHLAVIALAAVAALVWRKLDRRVALYGLAVASGFVMLCVVLRWQPWNSRLQLPLFVLAAPFVALVVGGLSRPLLFAVSGLLLIGALPYALNNLARPVVGPRSVFAVNREQQYFANQPALLAPYLAAREGLAAAGCSRIGLLANGNDWEYPLWVAASSLPQPISIEHVGVDNVSARLTSDAFQPCVIVSIKADQPATATVDGTDYVKRSSWPPLAILLPEQLTSHEPGSVLTADGV